MRYDNDLKFLKKCNDSDLSVLVTILTMDSDGRKRYSEQLTKSELYKKHFPKHSKYWEEIAKELQKFGGNTLVNLLRKEGVTYREILIDICDKYKVKYDKKILTEEIEELFMLKIFESSLAQMTEEQRATFLREQGITSYGLTTPAIMTAVQTALKSSQLLNYKFSSLVSSIILKSLGQKGMVFGANAAASRVATIVTGPIGMTLSGMWSIYEISNPAYRVTIPAVIEIIYLRNKVKTFKHKCKTFFRVWL